MNRIRRRIAEVRAGQQDGQTMAEYTVVISVITIAIVMTIAQMSSSVSDLIQSVISAM